MTTQEQYAAGFTRLKANDIQRAAVEKYLEEHREINRDYAYDIGLPACGRIKNLGARIMELREAGWSIDTQIRNGVCWYILISKPKATQLTLV